jgi:hypothetical protein
LDGLGFKKGVVVTEFSPDATLSGNASDTVPVESAIRGFVDSRLGLTYGGAPLASNDLIGPGFMALNGVLPMKGNINMANRYIVGNMVAPQNDKDATNKLYVDTGIASKNSLYKLNDVNITTGSGPLASNDGDALIYDYTSLSWKNIGLPTGDVNLTYNGTSITTTIQSQKIVNSMVKDDAAIAQSKLSMQAANTANNAPGSFTQSSLGLAQFNAKVFAATNGWIDLAASTSATTGVKYDRIQYAAAGTILGNRSGTSQSPSEMTPAQVVTDGNGIKNAPFTSNGVMVVTSVSDTTFNTVTNTGGGNVYGIVDITSPSTNAHANNAIVKTGSDGVIDVIGMKFGGSTVMSYDNTTLKFWTPGGSGALTPFSFMTSVGTSGSDTITTMGGTLDISSGTIKVRTITTGAVGTDLSFEGVFKPTTNSSVDLATNNNTLKVKTITTGASGTAGSITGAWTLSGTFQATYADLAEFYEGDQEYEPGTVLVFGGEKEVTTTVNMNDTRSAGVVTTDPAYVMNADQTGTKVCIALAGRVPCKVVGRVKKGDMLTTSATPGYAVKASDPKLGSIIGKALEDKDYGEAGVIQVAVGRV